ncbi:MAG: AAA family ATPase [Magnetococcus sp. MYC-9]
MIIQALQAENLFKYKKLSLTGLSPRGRILLSGANESGKTAIVETLCLGLFGRTAALEADQLAKAVKWGENHGSVTLTFLGPEAQSYTVSRYLDSKGHCQASLSRTGETEPLAKGVAAVNQQVQALAGFGFQHYIETLFLAQNDQNGTAREETIQALAGVAELDGLTHAFAEEIETMQEQIAAGDLHTASLQEELILLDLREEALGELEEERRRTQERAAGLDRDRQRWQQFADGMQQAATEIETASNRLLRCGLESTLESWQARCGGLEQALQSMDGVCHANQVEMDSRPGEGLRAGVKALQPHLSQGAAILARVAEHRHEMAIWLGEIPGKEGQESLQQAQAQIQTQVQHALRQRKRSGVLIAFSLLGAALLGAAGGVVQFQEGTELARSLTMALKALYAGWDPSLVPMLFALAVVFLLLAVNGVAQSFGLRRKIAFLEGEGDALDEQAEDARQRVQRMDGAAREPLARQVAVLTRLTGGEWLGELQQWADGAGAALLEETAQRQLLAQLQGQLESFQQEVAEDRTDMAAQQAAALQEQQLLGEELLRLESRIAEEQARRQQDQALRAQQAALGVTRQQLTHQIAVRGVARELLQGACQGLSTRFNQELRRFITRAAPLFTQGRYQHLRIDERLQVAAFSTIKNDFVDFDEISTGVRHQLLLAVRLALAQALAARVGHDPQFVVLDEPFVFFDRQRIRESLEALLGVSDQIAQVWVIAQEFAAEMGDAGDLRVMCLGEEDSLQVEQGRVR